MRKIVSLPVAAYRPRNPQLSGYYRCVEDYFETFIGIYDEYFSRQYGFWRPYLENVIYRYLDRGDLHNGFGRVKLVLDLIGDARISELTVRPLDVSLRACKAAMLQLNRVGRVISGMEEALVVHSLCHDDGLSQVEIGVLISRHKSWVCRRLSLIERLSDEAQQSIRLGLLPASFGAELAKLQRCNQDLLLSPNS